MEQYESSAAHLVSKKCSGKSQDQCEVQGLAPCPLWWTNSRLDHMMHPVLELRAINTAALRPQLYHSQRGPWNIRVIEPETPLSFPLRVLGFLGSCAGNSAFLFSSPCWRCVDSYTCGYLGGSPVPDFTLATPEYPEGVIGNLTTRVTIPRPAASSYRLSYRLSNTGPPPNTWQAIVGSPTGAFAPKVLEYLTDYTTSAAVSRQLAFSVPSTTTVITITFLQSNRYGGWGVSNVKVSNPFMPFYTYLQGLIQLVFTNYAVIF
eukprot:jgi/Botrbrau1/22468/Bobra.0685s0001.1